MYKTINQYFVVMEIDPQFQQSPDGLKNIYLRSTSTGKMVPLTAFTHYDRSITALSIAHQGPFPAVTFSFNLAPEYLSGRRGRGDPEDGAQAGIADHDSSLAFRERRKPFRTLWLLSRI